MISKYDKNYKPSYMYNRENGEPIYWDKMTIEVNGLKRYFTAYGDGSHCICEGCENENGCFDKSNISYHIGEIEKAIEKSTYVRCELDGYLLYARG